MASNRNRFIPNAWQRAAQGSATGHYNPYNFSSDYLWWPPVYGNHHNGYDQSILTTGAYQFYENIQTSYSKKKSRKQKDGPSGTKIPKKDRERSECRNEGSHRNANHDDNKCNTDRRDHTYKHVKRGTSQRSPWNFTRNTFASANEYSTQPSSCYHSWRRWDDKHISKHRHSSKKRSDAPNASVSHSSQTETTSGASTSMEPELPARKFDHEDESRHQLGRRWEDLDLPSDFKMDGSVKKKQIRIVSYNILSQKLLNLNSYLYKTCNPDILPWEYRWPKLKEEIIKFDAEVLCLQEVEECHYRDDISDFLESLSYQCHYKRRTGNNTNKPDGVLIAYKKHHFQMVSVRRVEYFRGHFPPVNQDNVALIAVLKPLFHGTDAIRNAYICFVNTHLLYNPKRGDIKLVQLSTLFAEIHNAVNNLSDGKVPIVMCGDFNSTPGSHMFDFITKQEIDYRGLEARHISGQKVGSKGKFNLLSNPLLPHCLKVSTNGCVRKNLAASHEHNQCHDDTAATENETIDHCRLRHSVGPLSSTHSHSKPEASTTQDQGITVDYIFHTPHERNNGHILSLFPTKRLSLIQPDDLHSVGGIPNALHPSDHIPIICEFTVVHR